MSPHTHAAAFQHSGSAVLHLERMCCTLTSATQVTDLLCMTHIISSALFTPGVVLYVHTLDDHVEQLTLKTNRWGA
jgi:hypothetical protein